MSHKERRQNKIQHPRWCSHNPRKLCNSILPARIPKPKGNRTWANGRFYDRSLNNPVRHDHRSRHNEEARNECHALRKCRRLGQKWTLRIHPIKNLRRFWWPRRLWQILWKWLWNESTEKALKILDNDCAKANLSKTVKECQHLSTDEKRSLLKLFQQCEDLFEGKVGTWNRAPVSLELKEAHHQWRAPNRRAKNATV